MARKRFHQLRKVKVRATWNKYNLYNLSRFTGKQPANLTFYQQKWKAKSITRAYHGEHIREKQWQRMFSPRLNAVVPMDHRYLAEHDGSELAAGRGSGLERSYEEKGYSIEDRQMERRRKVIPYMHQTYAPIERRLDMSVWRALFASSARQARQFVVHGKVKVNGKKMIYPGYLLNPGDLFQVEPESVMFATGAPKDVAQKREGRHIHRVQRNRNVSMEKMRAQIAERKAQASAASKKNPSEAIISTKTPKTMLQDNLEYRNSRREDITIMIQGAEKKQSNRNWLLGAKRKQQIRSFIKHAKTALAQTFRRPIQELEAERLPLIDEFRVAVTLHHNDYQGTRDREFKRLAKEGKLPGQKKGETSTEDGTPTRRTRVPYGERVTREELERLEAKLTKAKLEVVDPSKPYATPWRPRDFMSAFAFIPRYLEVNSKICAAVYLRHPVARPGFTEVPTPFPGALQQLAFNWYLRRR